MKKLQFLKVLVDLIWLSSIVGIAAIAAYTGYIAFNGTAGFPLKMNGENFDVSDNVNKILLIFGIAAYLLFAFAIYELRKLLNLFEKQVIFEDPVIFLLDRIGKSFVVSAAVIGIPFLIYNLFYSACVHIDLGGGPFLFVASLGLFFMVLSEVFRTAKMMKDENDLTV